MISHCNNIKEIYQLSDILKWCIEQGIINPYNRQFIQNSICRRIREL